MRRGLLLLVVAAVSIAASAKPHKIVRNTPTLEFSYEWPAEAAAIPALDARLYAKGKSLLTEAQKYAAEDQALAREQEREFHQHYYEGGWVTSGQTPRLLSLEGGADEFTGGAHPNHSYEAMLWDRKLNRPLAVAALFSRAAEFAALTRSAYCKALDAERLKRREGERLEGEFAECPKYSELSIAPVDEDKDGSFEAFDFTAQPYVAGPYVEGEYEIVLPVTARMIGAIKPEYRSSFKAQRQ